MQTVPLALGSCCLHKLILQQTFSLRAEVGQQVRLVKDSEGFTATVGGALIGVTFSLEGQFLLRFLEF